MATTKKGKVSPVLRRTGTAIVSVPELEKLLGVSRQTIWRMEHKGSFPPAMLIPGTRLKGWPRKVVNRWLSDWKAGRLNGGA